MDDIAVMSSVFEEQPRFSPYFIDSGLAETMGRNLSVLIESRLCYVCRQGVDKSTVIESPPEMFMEMIAGHCAQQPDFLLPDTPMKEAVFRSLLANSNAPMTAEEIGARLSDEWAMTQFPRNTSADVIQRLLDDSDYYCIGPAPGGEDG